MAALPGGRALARLVCGIGNTLRPQPKLAGVPDFVDSLTGAYFLGRCLFLPAELPALVGEEVAREGLAALGGHPPGVAGVTARNAAAGVGLLESTLYLRNQLLRDSDWASMAHSLELRTPLVDACLLAALGPCCAAFEAGRGKSMLAQSPANSLPRVIVDRPKSGFGIPLDRWLRESAEFRVRSGAAPAPQAPWARQWAQFVAGAVAGCA
jgi:asparagine synthase (glutamine-hydrolysing)